MAVNQQPLASFPALDCNGWYGRSTPHPDPRGFTPTYHSFAFALDLSAMIYQGFVMALFEPNVLVDRFGHILSVQESDFQCLKSAISRLRDLPYAPFWNVDTDVTCQSQFRAFIPIATNGTVLPYYVYAPMKGAKLEQVTAGYETLPDALYDLGELAAEVPLLIRGSYVQPAGNRSFANLIMKLAWDHCQWPKSPGDDDDDDNLYPLGRGASVTKLAACVLVAVACVCLIRRVLRLASHRNSISF
ncbi:hypothetical protein NEOLEDRAFT_1136939 [Neolentinus lepideus HHB14362 ss-1]|uniref:Uncharacterized protein n=1 Tax=Neolentinus lepideus HHB14362 ss-1 TaxID=1314782 RepID=A0A165QYY9_9AGAM|nr:hypothetical protein NEOLEDRAFT_1136939 [Neolentinus lepideus HHB14362 ss-1]